MSVKKIGIIFCFSIAASLYGMSDDVQHALREPRKDSIPAQNEHQKISEFCTDPIFLRRTPIPELIINAGQRVGVRFHNEVYRGQLTAELIEIKETILSIKRYAHTLPSEKRHMNKEELMTIAPLIERLSVQLNTEKTHKQHKARL